ncbi:hypothetical protein NLJ89_g10355 [Agrocybe chaxingu]|uniref:Uncharacterized protein n=1 Tax=Agrocybe chaxingu TaxID=84603 RepID=A0A9W8JP10_9AGAR|nr:hypothetical protein NLJ89_g10355 [Agrocybe chaxingu]
MLFSAVHIDWSNVTDVHFEEMTYSDCMSLFQQAPRLIKCSITTEDAGNTPHFNTPFIHPSLTHLTIVFDEYDTPDGLLDLISLPALQEMNYTFEKPKYNSFISLLERSGCDLTSLSLTNPNPPTSEDLANLLRNTSSLENFALQTPHIPPGFFELFTPPEPKNVCMGNPIFLPLLRTFQYTGSDSHISWKSFIEAAKSILRRQMHDDMPLPSFEFVLDLKEKESHSDPSQAEPNEVSVARLCGLIDRGIGLKISNGSEDLLQRAKRRYEAERFGVGIWDEESE